LAGRPDVAGAPVLGVIPGVPLLPGGAFVAWEWMGSGGQLTVLSGADGRSSGGQPPQVLRQIPVLSDNDLGEG